jgi:hypothetical protein
VAALNTFGTMLASLLPAKVSDDPVRTAIKEALIAAHADSSYVYVLRFLKMLSIMLDGCIDEKQMAALQLKSNMIRKAIANAFEGNMGDTTDNPVSPLISQFSTFTTKGPDYNALQASENGTGGWAAFWQKFHNHTAAPDVNLNERRRTGFGLPTTKRLAL